MSQLSGVYQISISGLFLTENNGLAVVTRDITDIPVNWTIGPPPVGTEQPAQNVAISLKIDFPKNSGIGPVEFPRYLTLNADNTISVNETRTPPTDYQIWTLPPAQHEPNSDLAHLHRLIQSVANPDLEVTVLDVLLPAGTGTVSVTAKPRAASGEAEFQKWTFKPVKTD